MDTEGTVYAWAQDAYGNTLKSYEAAPVKQTDVTNIQIEGISGRKEFSEINDRPIVGDVLHIALTPATSEADLEIQWYRSGAAITGATGLDYTVQNDDKDQQLSVKIKILGGGFKFDADLTSNAIAVTTDAEGNAPIAADVETVYVFLNTTADNIDKAALVLTNTAPVAGNKIGAEVYYDVNENGTTTDASDKLKIGVDKDVTVKWYRGEAVPANQIAIGDGYTTTPLDAGQVITAVATGNDDTEYAGISTTATATVKKLLTGVTVNKTEVENCNARDNKYGGVLGTRLTATLTSTPDGITDDDVTYTWYRKVGENTKKVGSNLPYYQIDKADARLIDDSNVIYTVEVNTKSSSSYTGSVASTETEGTITKNEWAVTNGAGSSATEVADDPTTETTDETDEVIQPATLTSVLVVDSSDKGFVAAQGVIAGDAEAAPTVAAEGDTIKVVTVPAAAAANFKWTWYVGNDTATRVLGTGVSVTVPDIDSNNTHISVVGTSDANPDSYTGIKWWFSKTDVAPTAANGQVGVDPKGTAISNGANNTAVTQKYIVLATPVTTNNITALKSVSLSIQNPTSKKKYDVPEVGTKISAKPNVDTGNMVYKWESERGTLSEGATKTSYTVTAADIGTKIKCTVTNASTSYSKARTVEAATEDAVIASTRTIVEMKVLKWDGASDGDILDDQDAETWYTSATAVHDKAAFDTKKSVSQLSEGGQDYIVVALDSEGAIVTIGYEGIYLDGKNSIGHKTTTVETSQILDGVGGNGTCTLSKGQKITIKVLPDERNYVGDELSKTFNSAVGL